MKDGKQKCYPVLHLGRPLLYYTFNKYPIIQLLPKGHADPVPFVPIPPHPEVTVNAIPSLALRFSVTHRANLPGTCYHQLYWSCTGYNAAIPDLSLSRQHH